MDPINAAALVVSLIALGMSLHFWRRQFRPIITAMVKTHAAGSSGIEYDLVVLNSGAIPAKNVWFEEADQAALSAAFGKNASESNKTRWLACFDKANMVPLLHNGAHVSCSFGNTEPQDKGFWKYGATFPITIHYQGWFGRTHVERNTLRIVDTDTFTGFMWE
jgi:hypothetical protein